MFSSPARFAVRLAGKIPLRFGSFPLFPPNIASSLGKGAKGQIAQEAFFYKFVDTLRLFLNIKIALVYQQELIEGKSGKQNAKNVIKRKQVCLFYTQYPLDYLLNDRVVQ